MMRTTVVLDDRLLAEARAVMEGATLRSVIETGLREMVRRRHRERLMELMGSGIVDLSDDDLTAMRSPDLDRS